MVIGIVSVSHVVHAKHVANKQSPVRIIELRVSEASNTDNCLILFIRTEELAKWQLTEEFR
jgi:hypothetical protein